MARATIIRLHHHAGFMFGVVFSPKNHHLTDQELKNAERYFKAADKTIFGVVRFRVRPSFPNSQLLLIDVDPRATLEELEYLIRGALPMGRRISLTKHQWPGVMCVSGLKIRHELLGS